MRTYLFCIVVLFCIPLGAQEFPYEKKWKEIEKKEAEGLLKNILPAVNEIYEAAKKEGNVRQRIRALLYRGKIAIITDDDDEVQLRVIRDFENEIAEADGAEKSILESMLAEIFYKYYQNNRWTINQRTRMEEASAEDFRFWSENIFNSKVTAFYLRSLDNAEALKQQPVENWKEILEVYEWERTYDTTVPDKDKVRDKRIAKGRELRPTLYDLVAHRAIDFFRDQSGVFFNSFEKDADSGSKKERAAALLRELADFHKEKKNTNGRLYNELEALKLCKQEYGRDSYIEELEKLARVSPADWYTGEVLLELARFYREQADREDKDDFKARKIWYDKTLALIRNIEKDYAKTYAANEASRIRQQVHAKDFSIRIESCIPSGQSNPLSVTHKNLDRIYFKVLKFHPDLNDYFRDPVRDIRYAKEEDRQKLLEELFRKYPSEKEFALSLKTFDDYQDHTTTAALEALSEGVYIVLATNAPDFKTDKEGVVLQSQLVNITDYAVVGNGRELLVTERESGHPQSGKTVEIYERDNKRLKLIKTVKTDASGKGDIYYNRERYYQYYYRIKGEDVFYNQYSYYTDRNGQAETAYQTRFFTDRSIYRPGQTVYFKAIHYKESPDGSKEVINNKKLGIELLNPNDETVGELELTTNAFGSVSGEFVLPASGITGIFVLESDSGDSYTISVEEYKRPRFEVVFDTVKETFRLGEEIAAGAKATAYSGANIDNAKVVYRVYRQAVYPYLPWWRRSYVNPEPREEITHGETITDAGGNFKIPFEAKALALSGFSGKKKEPRTYTYTVEADVTDINGETRSGSQNITVGDLRYTLNLDMPSQVAWEDLKTIGIRTENLNGQFMPAKGTLTLTKIIPPERVLRKSPLQAGDYELYDKEEFTRLFPNDPYAKEDKKENWKEESPVISVNFDTGKEKEISAQPRKGWKEGYYLLRGYIRDGQDSIPAEKLVYLYKKEKKGPVDKELFSVTVDKESYIPGDVVRITFASSAPGAVVVAELEYDGNIIKREELKISNDVKVFLFPVKESYRGNVFVHYYFGKYNTAQQGTQTITVPFEENKLEITAGTMRDKLRPGDEETWELTVSGKGKDAFLAGLATGGAEVLAAMYDASLDQFRSHSIQWSPYSSVTRYSRYSDWNLHAGYGVTSFARIFNKPFSVPQNGIIPLFDRINWFGFDINGRNRQDIRIRGMSAMATARKVAAPAEESEVQEYAMDDNMVLEEVVTVAETNEGLTGSAEAEDLSGLAEIQPRRALQETAFFFPHLKTDKDGNVKISFTTPESLTEWKFMALAHTPELHTANYKASVRTQKELMVVPNPPRFLREGDTIGFQAKVTNLSGKELSGTAQLLLFDAFTMQPVDSDFGNENNSRKFTASEGKSSNLSWKLHVPAGQQAVVYRVVAKAGSYSDGEESALPVLTNRMLVTETLPLHIREGQEKTFKLEKLTEARSATRENFKLTFEMTTNPVWYAIFSLPYLREFPYECSEQVFSRVYGNLISQHLVNSNPKIKAVFDGWNRKGQLQSRLELNEELKSLLLEETPWVRQAADEEEQMKRIAVLFDLNKMRNELGTAFRKLENKQLSSGGFPWFDGGEANVYITTHIVSGFGHLGAMGIDYEKNFDIRPDNMVQKAIKFIDEKMEEEWDRYKKNDKYPPSLSNGVSWMYARSYFLEDYPLSEKGKAMTGYFLEKMEKEKFSGSRYHQAMLSLVFHRFGKNDPARKLLLAVKDQSVESDEMGMYWKDNRPGWYWYNAPIETQALLIEAFDEVLQDTESVELMKVWLLKNRQTNRWASTKATTEAVFALMSTGKDWVNAEGGLEVSLGGEKLDLERLGRSAGQGRQQGSGYVKTAWSKEEIKPEMGTVEVKKTSPGVAWGALYWQYFEDLDRITSAETGVRFKKELFLKKLTDNGPELQRITEDTPIGIGDLVTVRLEIKNDRDMEFVHIKDMRASGFEPVNVLSRYKWQGGLGYYESTRDAATNFFADRMPKGVYVFEYDLRAGNSGDFSNGITSLQCMYAPEMSAHSEGIRVHIK
ncbi:alpha-2-macroglobulin family protein [Sinomicrobium pectinilyticum]|nr:alpha-2-macroglobulin family protein [Sinomicrobium pectinilyticum]